MRHKVWSWKPILRPTPKQLKACIVIEKPISGEKNPKPASVKTARPKKTHVQDSTHQSCSSVGSRHKSFCDYRIYQGAASWHGHEDTEGYDTARHSTHGTYRQETYCHDMKNIWRMTRPWNQDPAQKSQGPYFQKNKNSLQHAQ